MTAARTTLGARAESIVAGKLEAEGFAILGRNVRVGRDEIDIVAKRGGLLVFCEVRSRSGMPTFSPAETITHAKRMKVRRAAAAWLRANGGASEIRLDAAAVSFPPGGKPVIDYFEDAL